MNTLLAADSVRSEKGEVPNIGLEPTVPRVTPPAKNRNRRAARSAAQPGRYAVFQKWYGPMNRSLIVLLLLVGISCFVSGISVTNAVGPASPQQNSVTSAELPQSLSIGGQFNVSIKRLTKSPGENRALTAAEAAYPPRADVMKAMEAAHFKLDAEPSDTQLWWSSSFDGVRIAYAITADAVRYYLNLSEAFRQNKFKEVGTRGMERSGLTYSASVSKVDTITIDGRNFRDVYVVEMSLSWWDYCGSLCAMNFERSRKVVVNLDGTVLTVFGDGTPEVIVSWFGRVDERDGAA
jgi:hypothetical protein